MESAFAWIGKVMEWFGRFIPQIKLVRATHAGVKFIRNKHQMIGPGLHMYWPLTTEIETMPVARQTKNLVTQVLTTNDEITIAIGVVIVYEINDIVTALVTNWDINDTIYDLTQSAVVQVCCNKSFDYLLANVSDALETELTKITKSKLEPYGVEVSRCSVTDFAKCRVMKRLTGS